MTDIRDTDVRSHEEVDANMRRAIDAGWDARFGAPPFEHGEFVEGIGHSFTKPGLSPGDRLEVARVAAQLGALEGEVGFQEGPNNANPWGPWQGVWNAAWCDSFAQWGAVEHGGFRWPNHCQFEWKGDAYCPWTKQHAMELGYWRDGDQTPRPGWQVLFSWDRSGVPDHIGTVVYDNGDGSFRTVEGNYRDGVAYVDRDHTYVDGFVELPLDGEVNGVRRVLRRGYSGQDVRELQERLASLGYDIGPWGADGDFGPATDQAVRAFQSEHTDRDGNPLEVDGIVGALTWGALDAATQ